MTTDHDRARRIDEYLADFDKLNPQEQKEHYSVVLTWLLRTLAERATQIDHPTPRRSHKERFQ